MNRYRNNPILTRDNIPNISAKTHDVSSVFNPGAVKFGNEYILILRVQNRGRETFLMVARSDDGYDFKVDRKVVQLAGIEKVREQIYHIYDPRITYLSGRYYVMFAMDMDCGCRLGLAVTDNFCTFSFLGIVSGDDSRNGVLFSEKIGGKYWRLDRPNKVSGADGVASGNEICLSSSDDLLTWHFESTLFGGRFHYWDERIGSGPPPIKTILGWLHIYHGIAEHFGSCSIYQCGSSLLDLNNPRKVIARGRYNILEPRELYETVGQVPNVVFPSGAIVEEYDKQGFAKLESKVKIYYGAADTVVGLAETTIQELILAAFNYDQVAMQRVINAK